MSNHTSVRGALSVPMNAAKGSDSMEDPKPRPLRFFPTLVCNQIRSCTADSMQCALVCMLWDMPCLTKLTALIGMSGPQAAIGADSTADIKSTGAHCNCTQDQQQTAAFAYIASAMLHGWHLTMCIHAKLACHHSSCCKTLSLSKCCLSMQAVCSVFGVQSQGAGSAILDICLFLLLYLFFLVLFFYLIFDVTKIFLLLAIKVVLYLQ